MLNTVSDTSRTEKYYRDHPAEAFEQGFVGSGKVRRHGKHYYHRAYFFAPSATSMIIRLLTKYFSALDTQQNIPANYCYRNTKWEFAETAIGIFDDIRKRISVGEHLEVSSDYICPIPWAVIGPGKGRYGQNNFPNGLQDIFNHYTPFMEKGGFNCVSIDRPRRIWNGVDKLQTLINIYHQRSANFIFTCSILFLFDLVLHGGSDCKDFRSAFTNDNRIGVVEDMDSWANARESVFGIDDKNIDVYTGQTGWLRYRKSQRNARRQCHNLSNSYSRNNMRLYESHWEVVVEDVNTDSGDVLLYGEKVREHRSIKSNEVIKPYYTTHQSGVPKEDIEEPKNPYQDWSNKEMNGEDYAEVIREMFRL